MASLNLIKSVFESVEDKFGVKFSNAEKYAMSNFCTAEIELVARYELLKHKCAIEIKLDKLERVIEKKKNAGKEWQEDKGYYNSLSNELDLLVIKVNLNS